MIRNASSRLVSSAGSVLGRRTAPSASVKYLSTKQQEQNEEVASVDYERFFSFPSEPGYVRNSPFEHITIPTSTIDQYVWARINEWQNKVAAVCGVTDRQYTYAQLRDHSAAFAVRLQKKFGLNRGDTIAICLPNLPEFPIAVFGAIEAGMVVTTVNPIYTPDEISRQLLDSSAKLIISTLDRFETMKEASNLAKKNLKIICIRTSLSDVTPQGAIDFFELSNPKGVDFSSLIKPDSAIEDVAFLPYSSGTTGMPKGVQLSHRNITSNCEMLQVRPEVSLVLPTTRDFQDVLPCVLPFFHIYGLTVTMISKLALGCKLVTLPKFHPDTFLDSMAKYKGTVLHLVPPIIIFLGHHDKVERKHTESMRAVMSGAAPMGALDAERFTSRAPGVEFAQGYGLTESSPVVLMDYKGSKHYSSVGYPTPNTQAKIVDLNDPTNTGLGPNMVGELLVRGPQIMKGYHNNKAATDEMIIEGGWLKTGDLGYYDEDGRFYITDRLKELIKVKGFQVPPAELEELLRDHPKVADAAVVGAPHPISGETPRAFIVSKKGAKITEKELQDYVAGKVASYKRLEGGVVFLDAIPKNASGKILRRELKQKYC